MKQYYWLWILFVLILIILGWFLLFKSPSTVPGTYGTSATSTNTNGAEGNNPSPLVPAKPLVTTTGFASVSSTTAIIVGNVTPEGSDTVYDFQYGPTLSYGLKTAQIDVGTGWTTDGAAAYLTGLKPSTSYSFRLGATNAYGTVYGAPYTFITAAK